MKWNNVPLPEAHLAGLAIGTVLQILFSKCLFSSQYIGHILGWPLLSVGIGLCIWSVFEAKEMNIANPYALLKSGPYGFSRNPMYVGWALVYLGITCIANSVWILAAVPVVSIYIHLVEIRNEERLLDERFGDEYKEYRKQVRRYL